MRDRGSPTLAVKELRLPKDLLSQQHVQTRVAIGYSDFAAGGNGLERAYSDLTALEEDMRVRAAIVVDHGHDKIQAGAEGDICLGWTDIHAVGKDLEGGLCGQQAWI